MRRLLVLAVLAACGRSAAPVPSHFISIGTDALPTARQVAAAHGVQLQGVETEGDVSILALPDDEVDELAHLMHEQHDRCGGFIVHDSLEEARDAARGALHAVQRDGRPQLDYTLDRAALVQAVLPTLDAARILGTIRELQAMKNRYYQSETGAAASRWLQARWRSFTTRPDVTVELFDHGYAQQSVILTIPGTTHPEQVVVLGGHLDSIARGGAASTAPGADDDASGIATLTEIARALLASDYRPARTVQIMAYAAEEVGLRGSHGIAKDYAKRKVDVIGALQLDMTNYQGSDKDIWLMKDFTSAPQNTFLTTLIDTYVGATWGLDACGYACSDHASWYRTGVPASMPFEARMRDRNMAIHTGKDTLETSGDNAAHALKFARLGAAYAIELAKGEGGATATITATRETPGSSGPASSRWKLLAGLGLAALLIRRVATRRR